VQFTFEFIAFNSAELPWQRKWWLGEQRTHVQTVAVLAQEERYKGAHKISSGSPELLHLYPPLRGQGVDSTQGKWPTQKAACMRRHLVPGGYFEWRIDKALAT